MTWYALKKGKRLLDASKDKAVLYDSALVKEQANGWYIDKRRFDKEFVPLGYSIVEVEVKELK